MATLSVNGQVIEARSLTVPSPEVTLVASAQALPPISGGQVSITILDGITADIGETVAVVLAGDGVQGTFVGRVAGTSAGALLLVLTRSVGPIPAGTVIAVRTQQIVAAARITNTTATASTDP